MSLVISQLQNIVIECLNARLRVLITNDRDLINFSLFRKNVALVISFPAMHTSRENYDLNPEVRTN